MFFEFNLEPRRRAESLGKSRSRFRSFNSCLNSVGLWSPLHSYSESPAYLQSEDILALDSSRSFKTAGGVDTGTSGS